MIKRKWFDRREVKSGLVKSKLKVIKRNDSEFNGYISTIELTKVTETRYVNILGKDRCVLKDGHVWLQTLEEGNNYSEIAIFNEEGKLVEWYIDIILGQGSDNDLMPWYDDLYLDVIVFTDGDMLFFDEDELLDALNKEIITQKEYNLAYEVGNKLLEKYRKHMKREIEYTYGLLKYINSKDSFLIDKEIEYTRKN
ncbi:MAG: DUF402 domain-containing protein [Sarcina sp.]